jgi:hypothetical protein
MLLALNFFKHYSKLDRISFYLNRPKLCQFVQFEISPSMSHKVFIFWKITHLSFYCNRDWPREQIKPIYLFENWHNFGRKIMSIHCIYFSDSVAQCNIWRQQIFFKLLLATKCYNDNKYRLTSSEVSFSFHRSIWFMSGVQLVLSDLLHSLNSSFLYGWFK